MVSFGDGAGVLIFKGGCFSIVRGFSTFVPGATFTRITIFSPGRMRLKSFMD